MSSPSAADGEAAPLNMAPSEENQVEDGTENNDLSSESGDDVEEPAQTSQSTSGISQFSDRLEQLKKKRDAFSRDLSASVAKQTERKKKRVMKQVMKSLSQEDIEGMGLEWNPASESLQRELLDGGDDESESSSKRRKLFPEELAPFLHLNDKFKPVADTRFDKKSAKELEMEAAIARGDWELAMSMNDEIADAEVDGEISRAVSAKEFADKMAAAKLEKEKKKPPKLRWTFEAKKRWERKNAPL